MNPDFDGQALATADWRKRNKERYQTYQRAYGKKWRLRNPEKCAGYRSDPGTKVTRYKRSAKTYGREWALTNDEAIFLFNTNCHYCGSEPEPLNGIDRVDSQLGYVLDNVVPACRICNVAKSDMPIAEFDAWIVRLCAATAPDWSR